MIDDVTDMIEKLGGTVSDAGVLPDGSGFACASFPLPEDHWIYQDTGEPPAGMLTGTDDPRRVELNEIVREAAEYAVRGATMNGKEMDFDPDALVQNMVVGLLGYHTPDGTSKL